MAGAKITPQQIDRARKDLGYFAELIGWPVEAWQLASVMLRTRTTVLLAPRQCGKSHTLALLAVWWAFRKPKQQVLIVSSAEDSALDLLEAVREICSHPLLAGALVEELKFRVTLANGSRIRSVASTQRAIRGKTIDLLILDEASQIDDDVLGAAALPTTMARPNAKIVVAGTAWMSKGLFYRWAVSGIDGSDPDVTTFTWALAQCPWIVPSVVESARRLLPATRFRAEYLGEWIGDGDSFFPAEDVDAAMCSYPMTRSGHGAPAFLGADWGYDADLQAVAVAGVLDDGGANGRPVIVVPWCETVRRPYTQQEDEIAALAGLWQLTIMSEYRGVGIPPSQNLRNRLTGTTVKFVKTSQESKEIGYARLQHLLAARQIALPDFPELRRQLAGIVARPTPLGGFTIGSRTESTHDDLVDAITFALLGMPEPGRLASPPEHDFPAATNWAETSGGLKIPLPVSTVRAELSYADVNHGFTKCANADCRLPYPSYKPQCQYCGEANPEHAGDPVIPGTSPVVPAAAAGGVVPAAGAVPAGNQYMPGGMRCPAGHLFDGSLFDECPKCPGAGGSRIRPGGPGPGGGLPPQLLGKLGPFLGPGR